MPDRDETERPATPRTVIGDRKPGTETIMNKLSELADSSQSDESEEAQRAITHAAWVIAWEHLGPMINGPNLKWVLLAMVAVLLGPIVLLGTYAIDGGIRADGWGCYGTAAFCHDSGDDVEVPPAFQE